MWRGRASPCAQVAGMSLLVTDDLLLPCQGAQGLLRCDDMGSGTS